MFICGDDEDITGFEGSDVEEEDDEEAYCVDDEDCCNMSLEG